MIFVPVGHEDAGQVIGVERGEVGVDDVDAQAAVVEGDPAVDHQHFALLLEREAVHPDLAETAEGEDAERREGQGRSLLPRRRRRAAGT